MAAVDPAMVDDFLSARADIIDGARMMDGPFLVGAGGLICATGGDGQFAIKPVVQSNAVTEFEIRFVATEIEPDEWVSIGTIDLPSGTVLVGDPGFLLEYVPDPFEAPYETYPVWAILQLPGPGRLAAEVVPDTTAFGVTSLRCEWLPGS